MSTETGSDADDADDAITVYSDYVCPFCYLGRESLSAYQERREEYGADEMLGIDEVPEVDSFDAQVAARAQARGITGVPTFVYDGHAARGSVPPEHLERLVEGETRRSV
ncbi:MAG: DsbA family protein [Haloarculaceae archaeon]